MTLGRLLTIPDVAAIIQAEHRTVRRAIKQGELEAAFIGGKWLMREAAVEAWFQARRQSTRGGQPSPSQARRSAARERRGSVARLQSIEERQAS